MGNFAAAGSSGVTLVNENTTTPAEGSVAYVTSDYNSGYLSGDIKGAWLADTDTTNVVGTELITNGTFDTDTSGWTATNGSTLSVVSAALQVTKNGTGWWQGASQNVSTTVGQTYVLTGEVTANSGSNIVGLYITGMNTPATTTSTGTLMRTFVATGTTHQVATSFISGAGLAGATYSIDNISVKLADSDRSVNNNGLQVNGTITKSPVA